MSNLRIYRVDENYIEYLQSYEDKIMFHKSTKIKRPYIGIVLHIGKYKYFSPMTSPKPKHLSMKNSIDFIKIEGGKYGAINLNNMIPINDSELIDFNIQEEEKKYRDILINQFKFIKSNSEKICKNAEKLYNKVVNEKKEHFIKVCCDFKLLENKCEEYQILQEVAITTE